MKDIKYIFWKMIIHLLLMIMAMAFGMPLCAILSMNGLDAQIISLAVSGSTLVIFVLLQYWLIGRSDLSHISMKSYLLGETVAFALLTLIANGVLAIISKGIVPIATSYGSFPIFTMTHALNNILSGSIATVALYAIIVLLMYLLKKKNDPTLKGRNKTAVIETNEVASDD